MNLRLCGYSNIQADEGRYPGDQSVAKGMNNAVHAYPP